MQTRVLRCIIIGEIHRRLKKIGINDPNEFLVDAQKTINEKARKRKKREDFLVPQPQISTFVFVH